MTTDIPVRDRIGVIDIGSNSVRLVVFEGGNRSPSYFYNEKILCGLGIGLASSGVLNPEGRIRARAALKRFALITKGMRLTKLHAVATEAVRSAKDGARFCEEVEQDTGIKIQIISGEEEATLSAQGVLLSDPKAEGVICDIGGSSMELGVLRDGQVGLVRSSRLGPMSIEADSMDPAQQDEMIASELDKLLDGFPISKDTPLYLIGGSWRAMAVIDMLRRDYALHIIHDYRPLANHFKTTLGEIANGDPNGLFDGTAISERRRQLLPLAARVLLALLQRTKTNNIRVSSFGLREGVLYDAMSDEMRAKDPLISAARADEQARARFPGFGDVLFQWLAPAFHNLDAGKLRLLRAACFLHDIHWNSHPDYRAEMCFDAATHTNLTGIDHAGRVFLGWILMHRYKPRGLSGIYTEIEELISPEDRNLAQSMGLGIRLGAMMSGAEKDMMGQLLISGDQLEIQLSDEAQAIFGEVVRKRFRAFAAALGLDPVEVIS